MDTVKICHPAIMGFNHAQGTIDMNRQEGPNTNILPYINNQDGLTRLVVSFGTYCNEASLKKLNEIKERVRMVSKNLQYY